jgi:hypothetical protein
MVRSAVRRVSNHEASSFETRSFGALLRMRRNKKLRGGET